MGNPTACSMSKGYSSLRERESRRVSVEKIMQKKKKTAKKKTKQQQRILAV